MGSDCEHRLQDLRSYAALLEGTLDNVGAYVFTKDREGRYTYANRRVRELFGMTLEEIVGRDDHAFFSGERSSDVWRNDEQVLAGGRAIETEECNTLAGSGETRWFWSAKTPLFDASGAITGMCGVATDITERKRLEGELEAQRQLLQTVLDHADDHIYMKDRERRYLYVNQRTARLYGRPVEAILGRRDEDLLTPEVAEAFARVDRQVLERGEKRVDEERFSDSAHGERFYHSTKIPLFDEHGRVTSLIGFSHDITELVELRERLERMAKVDELTGAANRRRANERLEEEYRRARRYGQPLALLMFDIDHFKAVNDTHGHDVGDRVLAQLTAVVDERLRDTDLLARWGGEEFLVLAPETAIDGAHRLAEDLRRHVARQRFAHGLRLTISVGVAAHRADQSLHALVKRADDALYAAKRAGRDRVTTDRDTPR